jgi:hypothetical protein
LWNSWMSWSQFSSSQASCCFISSCSRFFFPSIEYSVSYLIPGCPVYAPEKTALDPERQCVGIETEIWKSAYIRGTPIECRIILLQKALEIGKREVHSILKQWELEDFREQLDRKSFEAFSIRHFVHGTHGPCLGDNIVRTLRFSWIVLAKFERRSNLLLVELVVGWHLILNFCCFDSHSGMQCYRNPAEV